MRSSDIQVFIILLCWKDIIALSLLLRDLSKEVNCFWIIHGRYLSIIIISDAVEATAINVMIRKHAIIVLCRVGNAAVKKECFDFA